MEFIFDEENISEDEGQNGISTLTNNSISLSNPNAPKFISKKEREDRKIEKQNQEVAKEKEIEETNKKRRRLFLQKKKEIERTIKRKERHKEDKEKKLKNEELSEIKNYYLGNKKKERKKEFRPKENSKDFFVFEWRESEDTSKGINPIYVPKNDASLLFGRGNLGGIDPNEIKKKSRQYEELLASKLKEKNNKYLNKKRRKSESKDANDYTTKPLNEMTERDFRIMREDHDIKIKHYKIAPSNTLNSIQNPIRNFSESNLLKELLIELSNNKITKPTPIQMQIIPIISQRQNDLIALSPTGSGKSLSFILPIITNLVKLPPINFHEGPYALILAPTRELASQLSEEFLKYSKNTKLRVTLLIGGKSVDDQSITLSTGSEVIIGTPGRVLDALEKQFTVLNNINTIVIDEADRMISENLEETLNSIIGQLNSDHSAIQTLLFSATMNPEVEKIAKNYLSNNPLLVTIGDESKSNIDQKIEYMAEKYKKHKAFDIVRKYENRIIIFLNHKYSVDNLVKSFTKKNFNAVGIHSGKSQEQREKALEGFKKGKYDILIATSVLARGIDVENVKCIINYDCPTSIEDYGHRIGRTGRAGKKGKAFTFLTDEDEKMFKTIRDYLIRNNISVPKDLNDHFNDEEDIFH